MTALRSSALARSDFSVSLALTAWSTRNVSLSLVTSDLIASFISPPMRKQVHWRIISPQSPHPPPPPPSTPVFSSQGNSAEDWVFSLQLYLPAPGCSHRICIPVSISITWLTFSIFTESENQKTAGPLLQLTLAGNVSPPFPPLCLQESSVKFKQTHWS